MTTLTIGRTKKIEKFEVGKVYYSLILNNLKLKRSYKIVKRTKNFIWFVDIQNKTKEINIKRVKALYNEETIKPLGDYKNAPIIGACSISKNDSCK
jgi:hypothetical protein